MVVPHILFITCMPLETPRSASMVLMGTLLERYPDAFAWFSLHSPKSRPVSPFDIPYDYAQSLQRFSRFRWLKQFISLIPWAWYLGHKAERLGRLQKAQVVLADLAFEAVVAGRVAAKKLGVPLLVSVHDDPVNRLRVKNCPSWLVKLFEREFAKTMQAATECAVISDYMGELYQKRYGIKTTTLFLGVEEHKCLPPKFLDLDKAPIYIGSVGSMNSVDNWNLLIDSIRLLNQQYGPGKFKIIHIGTLPKDLNTPHDVVEATGWLPENEYLRHLARIHVGFLNWSFESKYVETGRLSFPLKTHSYIQAQVPMLALGPLGSSAVRFVQDYKCGVVCIDNSVMALSSSLEELLVHKHVYEKAQKNVQKLVQIFSRNEFFKKFESFVSVTGKID